MFVKNNILLIGKSAIIKKIFYNFYKNKKIQNLSFRKSWDNLNLIENFEYIVVSGFHFDICKMKKYELDKYIIKYSNYIHRISRKCKKVYLICTDLDQSHSFSRVVYFYYNLLKKLKKNKYVEILSFKTLYGIIVHYKNLTKILNKNKLSKKKLIKFYLIKIPRSRNFDRLIRLFIDLILIKLIKKFSSSLR